MRFSRFLLPLFLSASSLVSARSLATITLPSNLAAPDAKVVGVLNKIPGQNKYLTYSEGPAVDSQGVLFFAECGGDEQVGYPNRIWKVPPSGQPSLFYSADNGSNGMEFDAKGNLVVCLLDTVVSFNPAGKRTILAHSTASLKLKRVNDVTIASDGAMYFTNHATGNEVFYRSPTGTVKAFGGFAVPNGVEWIEEEGIVYVTLSTDTKGKVVKYDAKPDGTLANPRDFASVPVPDGITVDEKGDVYVASWTEGSIYVFDKTGKSLGKIVMKSANPADEQGGSASNCVFGGPEGKTLYITGNAGCYQVDLLVAGRKRPAAVGLGAAPHPSADRAAAAFFDPEAFPAVLFRAARASLRDAAGRGRDGFIPSLATLKP